MDALIHTLLVYQNSQCAVQSGNSSITTSSTVLELAVNLTFIENYRQCRIRAGKKKIRLYVDIFEMYSTLFIEIMINLQVSKT